MIDILLATYNGEKYISTQIDSILMQSLDDFHLYIRDDGSTDNTVEIIREYQKKNSGKITFIADGETLKSAKNNFFELLKYSNGEYIFFCDQDDFWHKDKLQISIDAITKYTTPALIHTDMRVVDEKLGEIFPSFFEMQMLNKETSLNKLMVQNNVTGCTMCINKALKGLIISDDNALMHDWWIAMVCAAIGSIEFIDAQTVDYRQHGGNEVGAKEVRSSQYIKQKASNSKDVHTSIVKTYMQAKGFLAVYRDKLTDEQRKMLKDFSDLKQSGIIKRCRVLSKYKAFKSGFLRKIGQIIYG